MIGQQSLDRLSRTILDFLADYLKVSLGAGVPPSALIVPIDNEGRANGAIELGAMHALGEREQRFLELVAGNIGDFVEEAQYRERLQQVLEETQQEELCTSNEELEQQTTALTQAQVYLANQKAELEQSNDRLAELQERADALQRASRYKSEFLANMSHELRTPLNSSLILAKLLSKNKNGNLTPDQIKYALDLLKTTIFRLHDHRPEAAGHAGRRPVAPVLVPAGDRLHGVASDARGRSGTDALLAVDHHQGRAFAGTSAR